MWTEILESYIFFGKCVKHPNMLSYSMYLITEMQENDEKVWYLCTIYNNVGRPGKSLTLTQLQSSVVVA